MDEKSLTGSRHQVRGTSDRELSVDPEVIRKYGQILDLVWTGVKKHPQADLVIRAAQFSPFAALSGFDREISETARLTERKQELTEAKKEELDQKLMELRALKDRGLQPELGITYFQPDPLKEGGEYRRLRGKLLKIDELHHQLLFEDGSLIPAANIAEIEIVF